MVSSNRIDEPTPSGGDYSVITFFNDNMELVDESVATKCSICEYAYDGKMLFETFGLCSQD